jgi:hypothetical protein
MRLWSIDPRYLDSKGLVALWREGLLALEVLRGNTIGYRNHPQLKRFLLEKNPVESMKNYLWFVYLESINRGYHFNPGKITRRRPSASMAVTNGQLKYEMEHLKRKLIIRDRSKYQEIAKITKPMPHPLFRTKPGKVEEWESI